MGLQGKGKKRFEDDVIERLDRVEKLAREAARMSCPTCMQDALEEAHPRTREPEPDPLRENG
jgi:hypothetical protein